jgi:hypothetical protein
MLSVNIRFGGYIKQVLLLPTYLVVSWFTHKQGNEMHGFETIFEKESAHILCTIKKIISLILSLPILKLGAGIA